MASLRWQQQAESVTLAMQLQVHWPMVVCAAPSGGPAATIVEIGADGSVSVRLSQPALQGHFPLAANRHDAQTSNTISHPPTGTPTAPPSQPGGQSGRPCQIQKRPFKP